VSEGDVRLAKYLARCGIASRRGAERVIAAGRVGLNGDAVTEPGRRLNPESDVVTVDGVKLEPCRLRWIALHKPRRVDSTRRDRFARSTVFDLLPPELSHLHYVGRLDRDTSGLLLMTNDGSLSHRLQHPSSGVEREYEVSVKGKGIPEATGRLQRGISLDDGTARPSALAFRVTASGGVIRLVLREGRKREVRRMIQAVGLDLNSLTRVRFGPIVLGDLPAGEWREMTPQEIKSLHQVTQVRAIPRGSGRDNSDTGCGRRDGKLDRGGSALRSAGGSVGTGWRSKGNRCTKERNRRNRTSRRNKGGGRSTAPWAARGGGSRANRKR